MKVIYNTNIYNIEHDFNCIFFKNLFEEKIDEIALTLFEDIFIQIYNNNFDFTKEQNYEYLYKGLTYFGFVEKEKELIEYLKNKIYNEEFNRIQKQIKILFSKNGLNWNPDNATFFYSDKSEKKENSCFINNFYKKVENPYSIELFENEITQSDLENKNIVIPVKLFEKYINNYNFIKNFDYVIPIEFFKIMSKYELIVVCNNPQWFVSCIYSGYKCSIVNIFVDYVLGWLFSNPSTPKNFIAQTYNQYMWKFISLNPNVSINFIKKHKKQNYSSMLDSDFNIRERCKRKIQSKNYFDYEPLNILVKRV